MARRKMLGWVGYGPDVSVRWAQLSLGTLTGITVRGHTQAHLACGQAQVSASYMVPFRSESA